MEKDKIVFKGSHPDSLYRVATNSGAGAGKLTRTMRLLRWPIALVTVCVALAVFVYFLMPDNLEPAMKLDAMNGTYWESGFAETPTPAQEKLGQSPTTVTPVSSTGTRRTLTHGTKTQEIDFYDTAIDKNGDLTSVVADAVTESVKKRKLPIQPVYPTHIAPEVQYGDTENMRTPKLLDETNAVPDDSTLKPHITQKPEKPLAIYFKEADVITTTSTESITRAETFNGFTNYGEKQTTKKVVQPAPKPYPIAYKELSSLLVRPVVKESKDTKQQIAEPDFLPDIQEFYSRVPSMNTDVNFTSGHSKLFGISIEDAERMKSTTQSSIYNTRVSPTLPTWRDGDDTTTKKYPVNVTADVPQCRSTRLHFCRGILPYDLAGAAETVSGVDVTSLFPQIEYLVTRNCNARVKYFMCALLEPECNPPPYKRKLPCYSLCKAIMDSCDGQIPRELAPIFKCDEYSKDNCLGAKAPCFPREMSCGDGSCVPRDWMCDGTLDCPGGEDEAPCAQCDESEFTCPSGGCVLKRWVCDGYSDCPSGEDEDPVRCEGATIAVGSKEVGEESAGSAPAPSVKRPNRIPSTNSHKNAGETDSSQELLVTSDSGNAFKRNFTRRPSLSRLTPYNRPMLREKNRDNKPEVTEPQYRQTPARKLPAEKTKKTEKKETSDEDVMEDLGLFEDTKKVNKEQKPVEKPSLKQNIPSDYQNRAPLPSPLDKSIKNLERIIDGAALLKKAANTDTEAAATKEEDSPETNGTAVDDEPEPSMPSPVPRSLTGGAPTSTPVAARVPGSYTAHASPCPSGELRCVDGRCITLAQLCDGTIDCSDHADEDNCYT